MAVNLPTLCFENKHLPQSRQRVAKQRETGIGAGKARCQPKWMQSRLRTLLFASRRQKD
jgi:hypothetical protein